MGRTFSKGNARVFLKASGKGSGERGEELCDSKPDKGSYFK